MVDRLPAMCALKEYVEAGGLMSYVVSLTDSFRRAASFVHKIHMGAAPADLRRAAHEVRARHESENRESPGAPDPAVGPAAGRPSDRVGDHAPIGPPGTAR